jgi:hypothetical protein
MKKVNLTIKVPDWLYRIRPENIRTYLQWKMNEPHCVDCGKTMAFRRPEYRCDGKYPLKRNLLLNYYGNETVCQDCLRKRVIDSALDPSHQVYNNDNQPYNMGTKCDCCDQEAPTYRSFYFNHNFIDRLGLCVSSWNGSNVCLKCITTGLEFAEVTSSRWTYVNEKDYPLNEGGLPVESGKVLFPF